MADDRRDTLQGTSARGRSNWRQRKHGPHKRGLNTKIHLAVDAVSLPFRATVTEGTRADCKEAIALIQDLPCKVLLADRGYDTDEIIEYAKKSGIQPVIPPKKNRKIQRDYDEKLYKKRHLVEKRISSAKTLLARNRNPLCQKSFIFYRLCSPRLCYGMAQTKRLNLCRHALVFV